MPGNFRYLTVTLLAGGLSLTSGLPRQPAQASGQRIGVNVLLKRAPTADVCADLSTHGQVLEVIPEINALNLVAEESELPVIQALPYVSAANPDRPRLLTQAGGTSTVVDFASGASHWSLDAINVTDGLSGRSVRYDGAGVYVAVLDTGLTTNWRDYFPPERIAMQFARSFSGGGGDNGVVSAPPNLWEHDAISHGTAVTSIVLGYAYTGPEALPATFNGVAPRATIIPVKVFGNNHNVVQLWSSVITRGLVYLVDLKTSGALGDSPLVINMSFGGGDPDSVERAAIDYAIAQGVIVVAGAGNEGEAGMQYPAAYAPVISTANAGWVKEFPSDDSTGFEWIRRDVPESDPSAYFISPDSSRALPSQDLDLTAPGFAIPVPWTQNGQTDYNFFFGTSAACPHVAGVIALMLQKNPCLNQSQVECILKSTAMPLPAGCRDTVFPGVGPGNGPTWSDHNYVFFVPFTTCWGTNATGQGLVQADRALAATPLP